MMKNKDDEKSELDNLKGFKDTSGKRYSKYKIHAEAKENPMAMYMQTKGKDYYDTTMREYPTKRSKKI